ncbi:MAG: DUF2997 domain-containing protein [Myxococcales bacterium]|nr:DUF2997 domain-containing protein [Myxococcales bacterium]
MAQRKQLEIEITPTGEVKVRVKCVPGQACLEESKFLEEALGGEIKQRELTSEYYQQTATTGHYTTTGG